MRSARIVILATLLIGIGGMLIGGSAVYAHLAYLSALVGMSAWIWTRHLAGAIRLSRNARILRASLGDIFAERFEVANAGRVMASWVEIRNDAPLPFAAGSRLLTVVSPGEKRSYLARTWLTRRGGFPLGPTRVTVGDPFGLLRVTREIPPSQSLLVLPMLFEIQSFLSPPGLLPGGRVIRRKALDVTPHAAGLRSYMHGDPMKRIHWPTSIRRGELMVKEFEQDPQAEVWLVLDAQARVHLDRPQPDLEAPVEAMLLGRRPKFSLAPSTTEYAVSITASLARYFIQQRRAVGLLSEGKTYTVIPAERSNRQEAKILDTLAFVEARGKLSIAGLVAAQAPQLPQGSNAVIITTTLADDLPSAIDELQRRKLRPVIVLLAAESFGAPGTPHDLVRKMRERRIPFCMVACGDDLGRALSSVTSGNDYQDFIEWHRPPLSRWT